MPTKKRVRQPDRFRLEEHLLLARFIAEKIGINDLSEIKEFRDVPEGFDSEGRSHMFHAILIRSDNSIPEDKLRQYDDNIRRHFERWKKRRGQDFTLKYFQYLALLFTEILLDRYFNDPDGFLEEINEWILEKAGRQDSGITDDDIFSRINKVAYWMATGSGKTMIMNINYWQFMHYNKGSYKINYENILLITPSDEMTNQHLEELKASGIPAIQLQGDMPRYFIAEDKSTVKVISIHKLKLPEDKKGEGVTIDVSSLGSKNLVFVDEGHKGQTTEDKKWKQIRDWLVRDYNNSFTFEYSATFGQVISNKKEEAFREYSQAILYDYSYKYFYSDGYGKDFRILNVRRKFTDTDVIIMQLANLLSFYEQIILYERLGDSIKEYNIEKPLWVFVGSKVNETTSDVLQVVKFLNWFLTENPEKVKLLIKKILDGNTGILDPEGRDVFTPRYPEKNFPYLRSEKIPVEEIYEGILNKIFYIPNKATTKLYLINLKKTEGEIGLKAQAFGKYFGVTNIGNKSEFIKLVEEKAKEIQIENDVMEQSLFNHINKPNTSLNILIGAKKFLEGWNSWRVSSMCLLNIGKREGTQIIQLFGRGVRLKGKGYCLKRSRFIEGPHPNYLEVLETLSIYGIKANYMETFREIIEREDILYQERLFEPKLIEPFPGYLKILKLKEERPFTQEIFVLQPEDGIEVKVDLMPRGTIIDSREKDTMIAYNRIASMQSRFIDKRLLDLLDWNEIYFAILRYKNEKGWSNFIITKENLRQIIYQQRYQLFCPDTYLQISNDGFAETYQRITDLVILILKKYFERFYIYKRNAWERDRYKVELLQNNDENILKEYKIRIAEDLEPSEEIKMKGNEIILNTRGDSISSAYFQGHLYQPLLIRPNTNKIITIPVGLNKGEAIFIEDLSNYVKANADTLKDCEIYLLRNLTHSKGVGFFQTNSFYPDFIMWIVKDRKQQIIFIDPKGLVFIRDLNHPKLNLHEYLKNRIQSTLDDPDVKLDAFIISYTPYDKVERMFYYQVRKAELERGKHILFQYESEGVRNPTYIKVMFDLIKVQDM